VGRTEEKKKRPTFVQKNVKLKNQPRRQEKLRAEIGGERGEREELRRTRAGGAASK